MQEESVQPALNEQTQQEEPSTSGGIACSLPGCHFRPAAAFLPLDARCLFMMNIYVRLLTC